MNFPGIEWLPWLLILAGSVLFFAVWALYLRLRSIFSLIDRIYALNDEAEQDLLNLLEGLFRLLLPADCVGFGYTLDWYGQPIQQLNGKTSRYRTDLTASSAEVDVSVQIYWRYKPVGERWVATETVARTINSLIRMNLLIKEQAQAQAQLQASRNMLFLRHDVKNLAQFIHLQHSMLSRLEQSSSSESSGLSRAVRAAELARTQADEVLLRMQHADESVLTGPPISLVAFCQQKAEAFGISLQIDGESSTVLPASVLDTVLENLFSNAMQHAGVDWLDIELATAAEVATVVIRQARAIPAEHFARLFEPLASQSDEPGRGVGMYHCRTLLKRHQGDIHVISDTESATFTLFLPVDSCK